MVKSTAIATINRSSGREVSNTNVSVLTTEEGGLQEFAVNFHDEARRGCRTPDGIDNEHASPENPPMGDTQTDERNHNIFLPFP